MTQMAGFPFHKLITARNLAHSRGLPGITAAITANLTPVRRRLRRWWFQDREWLGRLVLLSGGRVRVEGCRFDVAHPLISNTLRARLVRGRYERSERALLQAWLDHDGPVIELGGGIGVVATIVNRRLRHPTRHVVVEANPSLIPVIEKQKAANGARYTVEHAAIDYSGRAVSSLGVGEEFISARLGATSARSVEVPTTTLERLLERYPWTGVTLVCDIEGTETQLVDIEGPLLARHCSTLIIEIHPEFRSAEECATLFARLDALKFAHVASVRKVHVFRNPRLGQTCSTTSPAA